MNKVFNNEDEFRLKNPNGMMMVHESENKKIILIIEPKSEGKFIYDRALVESFEKICDAISEYIDGKNKRDE